VLFDPTSAVNALWLHATEEAARALRVSLMPTGVRSMEDFEHALAVCNRGTRFVYNAERAAFGAASNHFRE